MLARSRGFAALGPEEVRVLGCLLEKQRTTPESYPLTLNALRLACNQSTNRDPVADYDEATVRRALERLARSRLTRSTSGHQSRVPKFRHLLDDALGLPEPALSLLAVLMLRGPQTPGELRQRVERLHPVEDRETLEGALEALAEGGLAERLERLPGQKEARYRHLLGAGEEDADEAGGEPDADGEEPAPASAQAQAGDGAAPEPLAARVAGLEQQVAGLREELAAVREGLDSLRRDLGA